MSSERGLGGYAREFSKSKSGTGGLVMLVILVALSLYALISFPPQTASQWNNPQAWVGNPRAVPPEWLAYVDPSITPTVVMPGTVWANTAPSGSSQRSRSPCRDDAPSTGKPREGSAAPS